MNNNHPDHRITANLNARMNINSITGTSSSSTLSGSADLRIKYNDLLGIQHEQNEHTSGIPPKESRYTLRAEGG